MPQCTVISEIWRLRWKADHSSPATED